MLINDSQSQSERSRLLPGSPRIIEPPSFWGRFFNTSDTLCCGKVVDDDVVSLGIKQLCACFSCMVACWLVSFCLIMLEVLQDRLLSEVKLTMFIPMWIGSVIGILSILIVSARVCRNATLISKERRLYMRQQGIEEASLFIDYDSLPLMRRLFCWNISLCITILFVLIAQILFSLWYIYGIIGLWHALIPVIVLLCGYLFYLYVMAFMSLTSCWFSTFAVFQLMVFILKCNGQLEMWSWTLCLIPLYIIAAALSSYTVYILIQYANSHYVLSIAQKVAMVGYVISLFTLMFAVGITIHNEYLQDTIWNPQVNIDYNPTLVAVGVLQYILCTISVCAFTLSLIIILNAEGRILARSRGFREPLPLSHTEAGWEPSHDSGDVYTMLLGTIEVALRSPAYISQHGINSDNLPPRSTVFHPQSVHNLAPLRPTSPTRRTEQENRSWEGEIELLLRKASPGVV